MFAEVKKSYEAAINIEPSHIIPDMNVYTSENIGDYGLEFLSYIDSNFV
jgi:hypothetical protein